jgi:hypothetical protein
MTLSGYFRRLSLIDMLRRYGNPWRKREKSRDVWISSPCHFNPSPADLHSSLVRGVRNQAAPTAMHRRLQDRDDDLHYQV